MTKSIELTGPLEAYVIAHSVRPDEVMRELVDETATLESAEMQISPVQGPLLHLLVRITGARRILEVGTFTGMSSLWMARALPPGGSILCCDVSEEWTAMAREAWRRAGVEERIELRLGPAAETLAALPREETFDLAFLDADKGGYPAYLEEIVPRLRPGGLLVADNVLRRGRVLDEQDRSEETEAIRRFNQMVVRDTRLEAALIPLADGVTLAWKVP